jgi:Putative adhesin
MYEWVVKVKNRMKHFFVIPAVFAALAALATSTARASEATFERDLTVSGRVDLTVATGSGNIHLTRGAPGHIHIYGRVKSSWVGNDQKVQDIAAHPPIDQTGNIVRIGARRENMNNISIDYEVQAPPDAFLDASSGSGGVTDEGVGANAKLNTGSGGIHATGLQGGFSLETGSGNIYAEQVGAGDVKAETGSGSIELKNLHGGLRAETGSGDIKAGGTQSEPWHLTTGAGSVELWTGDAGIDLDAESGSGSIHSDRDIATKGSEGHHHMVGKINGGGPTVKIETGSGSIRIH